MVGQGIRSLVVGAAVMLAVGAAWGADEAVGKLPGVLGEVPADAGVVLVVPSVKGLSTKASTVGARLGLPVPPDVVGFLLRNLGVTKGFDEEGSAAAMFLKAPGGAEGKEAEALEEGPPSLVLVPTNDAEGLLATFSPGEKDAAGIMEITLAEDTAEKAYAAVVEGGDAGKWIAVSEKRETLAGYLKRSGETLEGTLTPEAKSAIMGSDVAGWVNAGQVGPEVIKELGQEEQDITGRLDLSNVTAGVDAVTSTVEKQGVGLVFEGMKAAVRDATVGVVAVRMSDAGVDVETVATFGAKTETGKLVAAQKGQAAPGLKGLPGAGGFLVAGSEGWEGKSAGDLFARAVGQVLGNANEGEAGVWRSVAELQRQVVAQSRGVRFVALDGTGGAATTRPGAGVGVLNGVVLVDAENAERVAGLEVESFRRLSGGVGIGGALEMRAAVSGDEVKVKDVKLTKVQVTCAVRGGADVEEGKAELGVMGRVLGAEGLTVYVGSVGKQVVIIFGNDAATLEAGVAAAEGGGEGGGGGAGLSQSPGIAGATAGAAGLSGGVGSGMQVQGAIYVEAVRLLNVLDAVETGRGLGGGPGGRGRGRGGRGGRGGGGGGFGGGGVVTGNGGPAVSVSVGTAGGAGGATVGVEVFVPMATLQGVGRMAGLGGG
ncbi:MAG TPA: hypothetical protein VH253_13405 [Phycisphaerae bacterium]|nr:hypothetical protein [Phycisphaerae bacterium]